MTITARRAKTREKLIEAAIHVFAERGVAAASIEELTEAAGMTRGAFYSNFESKDELVLAIIEWVTSQPIEHLAANMETLTNPVGCPPPGATKTERLARLTEEAHQVFESSIPAMDTQSRDWIITQREIELYALRVPRLQAKYRELLAGQLDAIGKIVEPILAAHGAHPTIDMTDLMKIFAAVASDLQFGMLQTAVEVDAGLGDAGEGDSSLGAARGAGRAAAAGGVGAGAAGRAAAASGVGRGTAAGAGGFGAGCATNFPSAPDLMGPPGPLAEVLAAFVEFD